MEERYTMEEFKKMFNEAEKVALKKLDSQMDEVIKEEGKEKDGMFNLLFSLQNIMAITEVKSALFKKEQ